MSQRLNISGDFRKKIINNSPFILLFVHLFTQTPVWIGVAQTMSEQWYHVHVGYLSINVSGLWKDNSLTDWKGEFVYAYKLLQFYWFLRMILITRGKWGQQVMGVHVQIGSYSKSAKYLLLFSIVVVRSMKDNASSVPRMPLSFIIKHIYPPSPHQGTHVYLPSSKVS